ncbi:UDP-N-acetylmuramoyl-tripeptide--D-alanyl-D-alanine ligase [Anaerococcus sp. AGMB00486]|uniref:UDP-N-acetylmuramoyl-tripeptide--D-alanyl-D-alanine ligase n=2 Tax=Anaerococcus TaxID=165779 RepID=A0ABX2NBP3_9FIRM|nr:MULTISPECIES: UDP-N-acetylmuramoyl-tripeptide--D-alanyl-D-alanine ligase [Anaerococcus]MDY3006613.1 UDP-N-acetylmuramoyl-tripeptide--D-alanyl-D-alanine ligase [Anaerococcus porci]MSS78083.1 UDP-N-acetylmuramoyl-tripeptide--D-alanyl-D-alanine ligase [Anaerococcus porci]NVF12114.1 UDP-N-acetylmuramoyl-tripeptide--D-alanyl-D-alanine ligase [Anaerococcus faecalis]
MGDMLLIKKLDKGQFNSNNIIPVTFTTDTSDRCKLVGFFNYLKEKNLVKSNRIYIKNSSFTIDIISSNITKVTKELIENNFMIYGVYILYDDYLEGECNE